MSTKKFSHSRHSNPVLPAVEKTLIEFHVRAQEWLESVPRLLSGRVYRATLNATTALDLARCGTRRDYHLRRAMEALLPCFSLFFLLHAEKRIDATVVDEALRRLDQILAGIEQLDGVPDDQWANLELPPLAPSNPEGNEVVQMVKALIARVADSARPPPPAAPDEETGSPGDDADKEPD